MSHNFNRILQLLRHPHHTPTSLSDIVVSYDESPLTQPPPLQDRMAAVRVQLEALAIDAAQDQDAEEDHAKNSFEYPPFANLWKNRQFSLIHFTCNDTQSRDIFIRGLPEFLFRKHLHSVAYMSHNTIFFGTPRLSSREDDLYLPDPETIIASYEPPTVLPPTIQDHHDVVQVQLDAIQTLKRVLIVTVVMIAVAALVVVIAVLGQVNDPMQSIAPG
ncbi:hypothetical protein BKA57DRAFT_504396 [Linnemannia elongata]|nr:hypothetical protein BKA57DRAFT_504396 [Linnemannia elongata]